MTVPSRTVPAPPASWSELARRLTGERRLTAAEVAARSGCTVQQARRLWGALGLPPVLDDERAFAESDVEIMRAVRGLLADDAIDVDVAVQVTRVIGRAMALVADAFLAAVVERATHTGSEESPDMAVARRVDTLGPVLEPFLLHVWRHHLVAASLRAMGTGAASGAEHVEVVGFADLVGFTALSQRLDAAELTALVDRFEALAYERIGHGGGRVVKMIGDEVMFAVDDPVAGAGIALDLVEACASDPALPPLRVGIALGPTLAWEGDLFGPTVNLASRLVGIARSGTVLASDELGHRLEGHPFVVRHLRPLALKGLGRVRFWVVRRWRDDTGGPEQGHAAVRS